ncbi:MAG TPA: hypothetical protein VJ085_00185 [Candidatus Acidoferrales bacterium]|nr:hypothetical protein [Candidatus Acidoferrales bacterium]
MFWVKLTLLLLVVFFLALLFRVFRGAQGFKRRFDDSSAEATARLRGHLGTGHSPESRVVDVKPTPFGRADILNMEQAVLRALCTGALEGPARQQALRWLDAYAFQDVIHQLIFDALREIRVEQPELIRQQLPARLTQKGFPEVDFEKFLAAPGLNSSEALGLAEQLRDWAQKDERPDDSHG